MDIQGGVLCGERTPFVSLAAMRPNALQTSLAIYTVRLYT